MEIISMKNISLKSVSMKSVSMAGKTDGELYEGYPLEVTAKSAKKASAYTIFGNTNASAVGVGTEIKNDCGWYNLSNAVQEIKGNIIKITPSIAASRFKLQRSSAIALSTIAGHKYYVSVDVKNESEGNNVGFIDYLVPNPVGHISTTATEWDRLCGIITETSDRANAYVQIYSESITPYYVKKDSLQFIDLTALFGSGNEPTSVADFLSRLGVSSLPYLPFGSTYHIGVVDYADAKCVDLGTLNWASNGFGAYVAAVPNMIKTPFNEHRFACNEYTIDNRALTDSTNAPDKSICNGQNNGKISIVDSRITSASVARTILSGVWLTYQGENSPYFSAKKSALFLTQPLNKIGELVDSVDNKGKEYHALGYVDLGSLTWTYNSSTKKFTTLKSGLPYPFVTGTMNAICDNYEVVSDAVMNNQLTRDLILAFGSSVVSLRNLSYTTGATMKEALRGVYLVYPLVAPSTATAVSVGKIGVQKGDNVITADTEVKPTKIKAKI